MKFLKILCLGFAVSILGLTSCNKDKTDPYASIIKESENFKLSIDVKEYESGQSLKPSDTFHVTLNGETINYENNTNDNLIPGTYFITTSNKTPYNSRIKSNYLQLQSGTDSRNVTIYVGMLATDEKTLYVSNSEVIVIKNKGALKPWVMWVGGAGVIIAATAIVFFTKKYKETHP